MILISGYFYEDSRKKEKPPAKLNQQEVVSRVCMSVFIGQVQKLQIGYKSMFFAFQRHSSMLRLPRMPE